MCNMERVEISQALEDAGKDVEEVTTDDFHQMRIIPVSSVEIGECKLWIINHHPR